MRLSAVLCLATVLGLAAAPAHHGAPAARTVTLTGTDAFRYDPATITAAPGESLHVVLKVASQLPKMAMAHNFVILKPGNDIVAYVNASAQARDHDYLPPALQSQVLVASKLAGAGETVEVTFTAPAKAGSYTFFCSFPGHYLAGMKGTLTVK
jgi:azurin